MQHVSLDAIGSLEHVDVLYDFEGPCVFESRLPSGTTVIAYLVEELEEERRLRYLVVPVTNSTVQGLKDGVLPLRNALTVASCWVVDTDYSFTPQRAFAIESADIPSDCLPTPEVLLRPPSQAEPTPE